MKYLQTIKKDKDDRFPLSQFIFNINTSNMLNIVYKHVDSHNMYNKIYSRLNISLWKKLYWLKILK